jgi:hypothetical protein
LWHDDLLFELLKPLSDIQAPSLRFSLRLMSGLSSCGDFSLANYFVFVFWIDLQHANFKRKTGRLLRGDQLSTEMLLKT